MGAPLKWKIEKLVLSVFAVISVLPLVKGFTDPIDVFAMFQLQKSLGFPLLSGWFPGGDPCGPPSWEGVECVNANITAINLRSANLSGELTGELGLFASIIQIDLGDNQIGGSIPSSLPVTMRSFSLTDNQFTGTIPEALSSLDQLTDLSLSGNQLTGPIPDAFEPLKGLTNMNLSGNKLTGELPPSMGSLFSLTALYLQNNELTGTLDVLQDLPLIDLNVENNLFSGPIPPKLLIVPDFRRAGNPFNTTVIPPPPASPPQLSPSETPSPDSTPVAPVFSPPKALPPESGRQKHNKTTKILPMASVLLLVFIVLGLVLLLSMMRCCKRRRLSVKTAVRSGLGPSDSLPVTQTHKQGKSSLKVNLQPAVECSQTTTAPMKKGKDHRADIRQFDENDLKPNNLHFPRLPAERIIADPTYTYSATKENTPKMLKPVKFYTIASLQQYTNSFSEENIIGRGTLGVMYAAQLPNGKVLAVKKLDKFASAHLNDKEFLELVSSISKLHHVNITKLVGYCLEHGQRLLVYHYYRSRGLDEALNLDGEMNKNLSWSVRMHLALQAAKALEYLHEMCQPPITHRNFKSYKLLLQDDLSLRVSGCGLAPLLPIDSLVQLQSSGYGAPELASGNYSWQSDVYSFGVVMLQLITGRKSCDRSSPPGKQYLVRWALTQLHDIESLSRMVDPSLNGDYPSKSLSRVADIISLCIQPEPEFRPPMSEIVQKLANVIQREAELGPTLN